MKVSRKFTLYSYGKKVREAVVRHEEEDAEAYLFRVMVEDGEIDGNILLRKIEAELSP